MNECRGSKSLDYLLKKGEGRNTLYLRGVVIGDDITVFIYNDFGHIGAVSIGEYDSEHKRASVSVITRLGHKDDFIAQKAAYAICKSTQKTVCIIAGVHLPEITQDEIKAILKNAELIVDEFIDNIKSQP
jgi:gallate decarboxylase subunit D